MLTGIRAVYGLRFTVYGNTVVGRRFQLPVSDLRKIIACRASSHTHTEFGCLTTVRDSSTGVGAGLAGERVFSDFRLPTSDFRLPTSDCRLPTSDFRLPTSDFRLPTSDFRLPTSDFRLPSYLGGSRYSAVLLLSLNQPAMLARSVRVGNTSCSISSLMNSASVPARGAMRAISS